VFLAYADCDDPLPDVDPAALLSILQAAAPSCEIVTLVCGEVFLGG
jgi:hypothetical protein